MGRSVTFGSLSYKPVKAGVAEAPITAGDVSRMSAQLVRVDPGARFEALVPGGSDGYLFMLTGAGRIAVGFDEIQIDCESFAAVSERNGFSLLNSSATPAEVVYVLAPPQGSPREHPGLAQPLAVISRAALGHAAQPLKVRHATIAACALLSLAAALRVVAPFAPGAFEHLLAAAGTAWTLAFLLVLGVYTPILVAPRAGSLPR